MTGKKLYQMALDLCGLRRDDGEFVSDTKDLEMRSVMLINILLGENASLDCRIRKTEHEVRSIMSLDENIDVSDIVANSVLPYGLARLFMLGEDDNLAANFNKLYVDGQKNALKFGKASVLEITEVYV